MFSTRKLVIVASLCCATAFIGGCGGTSGSNFGSTGGSSNSSQGSGGNGGSQGTGSTNGGSSTMSVYVTDGFNDQYSQVWITLYKIEVSTDGKTWVTVYSDTNGNQIDLSSLASTTQFLSSITVPAGTYQQARVTFGNEVTLVPSNGGKSTEVPVASNVGTQANGMVAITLMARTNATAGALSNLVIDFRLASFQIIRGSVVPYLQQLAQLEFEQRPRRTVQEGAVSNLKAGTSFTLTPENGGSAVTVDLTTSTTIFAAPGVATTTLADGDRVEVKGTIVPATGVVTATTVKIEPTQTPQRELEAGGTVSSIDSTNSSFDLTLQAAEHFRPTAGTATVTTSSGTSFVEIGKPSATFSDIAAGSEVLVIGTAGSTAGTIAAQVVVIFPAGGGQHH